MHCIQNASDQTVDLHANKTCWEHAAAEQVARGYNAPLMELPLPTEAHQ